MDDTKRYFFCGIGGSGMLPLAMIVRARGAEVWGSDRSLDQGRISAKFQWLERQGIRLFPQDGSGIVSAEQTLVASAAIENTVPDVGRAEALGCNRMTRADLNAALFNASETRIGVGGTSGKSTVTGMIGWIFHKTGRVPTVMNGAVMRNFSDAEHPFASALAGGPATYVSEVDESDGSIAQYDPTVAVVTNISLDHKSLDELRRLFGDFAARARHAIINADDPNSADLLNRGNVTSFGFAAGADVRATDFIPLPNGCEATVSLDDTTHHLTLRMPGRHNVANALAAIAACQAAGVAVEDSVSTLANFAGLARRFEVIGTANGITVIDDFGHNPDKVAATLAALATMPGRCLLFFQPHGYGPLRQMGSELAASFATGMRDNDRLFVCDPVYFGGTVDRSVGSAEFVAQVNQRTKRAAHRPTREACANAIQTLARPGDRIVVLGARDDTLTEFARTLLEQIQAAA